MEDASVMHWDDPIASTITARIYKGIGANGDNMVVEICKAE